MRSLRTYVRYISRTDAKKKFEKNTFSIRRSMITQMRRPEIISLKETVSKDFHIISLKETVSKDFHLALSYQTTSFGMDCGSEEIA